MVAVVKDGGLELRNGESSSKRGGKRWWWSKTGGGGGASGRWQDSEMAVDVKRVVVVVKGLGGVFEMGSHRQRGGGSRWKEVVVVETGGGGGADIKNESL